MEKLLAIHPKATCIDRSVYKINYQDLLSDFSEKGTLVAKYIDRKKVNVNELCTTYMLNSTHIEYPKFIKMNKDCVILYYEYYPNGTLHAYLPNLSLSNLTSIFIDILSAIQTLHRCNYIHHDVKPENIIIDNNLCGKLIDFGLTKSATCSFSNRRLAGTNNYMSPEKFKRESSKSCDIWAFAVTMFYCLSNRFYPYEVDKTRIYYKPVQFNRLPWLYRDLLERMLNMDRSLRLQNIRSIKKQLKSIQKDII